MPDKGIVILVGTGPGDPGLLTLAGKAAVEKADVILYDRLVGDEVLALMPSSALKIDVGKNKGNHPVPQEEINRLILDHAREGRTVVRLKGGDPYLFGRGAEELETVVAAGIPFRVVPGVTSAIAAPACAGIPVTHRDFSSSLHIFTGHGRDGGQPRIPYRELASLGGTLVFLMGVSAAAEICRRLIDAGMAPETPAALVENGTRPEQRRLSATLATLPELAVEKKFISPSVLVAGPVVGLAERFDWAAGLPLRGKRILVVSSRRTGSRLARLLRECGCAADEFVGISLEPLPQPENFWKGVGGYDWIVLTSRFGVDCFFAGLFEAGFDVRTVAQARFAVVGRQTGQALAERGILPDLTPKEANGQALGFGLSGDILPTDKVLLFRAETGGDELPEIVQRCGCRIDDVPAYRTLKRTPSPAVLDRLHCGGYDALTFTSASAVESFAAAVGEVCASPPAFCIGKTTAAAAEKFGMAHTVSAEATLESMADAITERLGTI